MLCGRPRGLSGRAQVPDTLQQSTNDIVQFRIQLWADLQRGEGDSDLLRVPRAVQFPDSP